MDFIDQGFAGRRVTKAHEATPQPVFILAARIVVEHAVALAAAKIETKVSAPVGQDSNRGSVRPIVTSGVRTIDDRISNRTRPTVRDHVLHRSGHTLAQT